MEQRHIMGNVLPLSEEGKRSACAAVPVGGPRATREGCVAAGAAGATMEGIAGPWGLPEENGRPMGKVNGHCPLVALQQAVAQIPNGGEMESDPPGLTVVAGCQTPPHSQPTPEKASGSPEIKLKITKTYFNGKALFESSLCGDLVVTPEQPGQQQQPKESSAATAADVKQSTLLRTKGRPRKLQPVKGPPGSGTSVPPVSHSVGACVLPARPVHPSTPPLPTTPPLSADKPPVLLSPQENSDLYSIGDVVWAKISGHPWWPCMVSCDPKLGIHMRVKVGQVKSFTRQYHVQFFGEAAERAWVCYRSLVMFSTREQYELLVSELAKRTSSASERTKPMASRVRSQWFVGIAEAEAAAALCREERNEKFTFIYFDVKPKDMGHHKGQTPSSSRKRKSKDSVDFDVDAVDMHDRRSELDRKLDDGSSLTAASVSGQERDDVGNDEVRRAREHTNGAGGGGGLTPKKKRGIRKSDASAAQFIVFCQKHREQLVQEQPELSPVEVEEALMTQWEALTEKQRARYKSKFASTAGSMVPGSYHAATSGMNSPPKKRESALVKAVEAESQSSLLRRPQAGESGVEESVPRKRVRKEPKTGVLPTLAEKGKCLSSFVPVGSVQPVVAKLSDSCKPLKKRSRASTTDSTSPSECDEEGALPPDAEASPAGQGEAVYQEGSEDSQSEGKRSSSKRDALCLACEKTGGGSLVSCEGQCCGTFHVECLGVQTAPGDKVMCNECSTGLHVCFACKCAGAEVRRCAVSSCGRFYHEECVQRSSAAVFEGRRFRCPLHVCLSCHLAYPASSRASRGRMQRCVRCPVAYHTSDSCLAAGSKVLSPYSIVCSGHFTPNKRDSTWHVNVNWCFLCSRGAPLPDAGLALFEQSSHYLLSEYKRSSELGKLPMIPVVPAAAAKACGKGGCLLCCESCPAAFHPECLGMEPPEGTWCCAECRAGKKPQYHDIVWVKLGNYRWWPAEICQPRNIPQNIQNLKHTVGQFPVQFFGSHDYYWTTQGRVFPYMEGDKGSTDYKTNCLNKTFKRALLEAAARYQALKAQRETREAQETERSERKPPTYKHIKSNKPVGRVQVYTADVSEIPRCNCKPTDESPCGLDSECLNRMLQYECHPSICPAGDRCQNQAFTKRAYPPSQIVKTAGRGWGLLTLVSIRKGEFVNEYVGELIDEEECRKRIKYAHEKNLSNFYMLTIEKDRIIDAGPKGNFSRFMNHSCQPNCETQKWTVNGDTRVGLFATSDIATAGTELTFNYNLDCLGNEKTICKCGAPNCSGFLGVRPKTAAAAATEEKAKKAKRKARGRRPRTETARAEHEDECYRCGDGGELVMCDKKACPKAYHLSCLNLTKPPFGKWECPWHHCDVCGRPSVRSCELCPNSFCKEHQAGLLTRLTRDGRICCEEHDGWIDDIATTVEEEDEEESAAAAAAAAAAVPHDDAAEEEGLARPTIREIGELARRAAVLQSAGEKTSQPKVAAYVSQGPSSSQAM
uniref:Histone-lysine N-methyltransferase NSD2-like isoform X4 n=1 Tax=Petromyzon marinus TaxID=7757 RepID=A0AAJ7WQZ3_PETMA|nr:histone-lysine N-methyltransferase NSD2-like isoform X4 [Petromyzon marinus]